MAAWRGWRVRRGVWMGALCAGALLVALTLHARAPAELHATEEFPGAAPHRLAHLLADFSLQPDVGWWSVVSDGGDYSTWRYAVAYSCGARCAGSALVEARTEGATAGAAPRHGHAAAARHRVTARLRTCTGLPLLPWPQICEDMQTECVVRGAAGGARVEAAWLGRRAALRPHLTALLRRVRAALAADQAPHSQ